MVEFDPTIRISNKTPLISGWKAWLISKIAGKGFMGACYIYDGVKNDDNFYATHFTTPNAPCHYEIALRAAEEKTLEVLGKELPPLFESCPEVAPRMLNDMYVLMAMNPDIPYDQAYRIIKDRIAVGEYYGEMVAQHHVV